MMVAVYSMPVLNPDVQVYATGKTADQAISWVKSKVGTGIDYDGQYGCQCVDLILAYYNMLGVSTRGGNAKDYATNSLPEGWARVKGGKPQKGDILVFGEKVSGDNGHVAIYESDTVVYHQNRAGHHYVEKVTDKKYNSGEKPYWGFIRPNWSNAKVSVVYNVNGGLQSISTEKVLFGNVFNTPTADATKRPGYTLTGFNCYRYKDDTYYVSGTGWVKASKIGDYTKALYKLGSSHRMSTAWIKDGDFINYNKLRFDAVWKANNHTIKFNGNGAKGTIPANKTVATGKKFKLPTKGKMKKGAFNLTTLKGWTVVRNADKKYYAKDKKWYANNSTNRKKHPPMVYKPGSEYKLGAKAWLSNSMTNTKTSFTFTAQW